MRVDESSIPKENVADLKISGYAYIISVLPKRQTNLKDFKSGVI